MFQTFSKTHNRKKPWQFVLHRCAQVIVLQGERPLAKDNKKLGMFRLDNIPAAPKGPLSRIFLQLSWLLWLNFISLKDRFEMTRFFATCWSHDIVHFLVQIGAT